LSPSKDHEVRIRRARCGGRGDSDGNCTGKLTKNLNHLAVNFSHPKKDVIQIELHHGARKNVATLRTVRTLINNLIIGVTKGFKYKMRYVYAHFPINVNVEKNNETGLFEVEIRYVDLLCSEVEKLGFGKKGEGRKWLTGYTETSLARRLSEESLCNLASMLSPQKTRRMSCSCTVTRSRTSHNPRPTSSKSAEYETRISGR
jgi:Ribosomal protein L6